MSLNPPQAVDRYQILQPIGQGGMGTIYLARDPKIGNRQVVIKLLREGFDNAELRERFSREADAAGGLRHVNIVTIFDVGEFDGQPFIAMEYIQGETLTDLIHRRAPMSLGRKLQLMEELCAGLRYAHRAGIVHRDIKPANIMVDQDGVLKILDFGIARLGAGGMTRAGMVMGTLNYMAPEQMAGQPVDARADIFSAGAVFYELLSHQRAFPGDLPGIVHKIMTATREPLAKFAPDLDPGVIAIVDRCLARDLPDRYEDMAAVRRDIAALRQRIVYDEQRTVDTQMGEAQTAIKRGDFQSAIDACQRVLAFDSEYQPALELQQQARALLDSHQVRNWLQEAEVEIDRGAITAAGMLVGRAEGVTVNSSSPEVGDVRKTIDEVKRRIADARARNAQIAGALDKAREQLEKGALDTALGTVDDALALDGSNTEAAALKERIVSAIAERHRLEEEARARAELDQRAHHAVEQARTMFAERNHAEALKLLEEFRPAHQLVTAAIGELRQEAREIERRRVELEQQQAQERKRQAELAQQRAAATIHIAPASPEGQKLQAPLVAPTIRIEPQPAPQAAVPAVPNAVVPAVPKPVVPAVPRPAAPAVPRPVAQPAPTLRIERGPVLEKPPVQPAPVPAAATGRSKVPLFAGVGVLLVAAIGVWLWTGRTPTPAATTAPVSTTTPESTTPPVTANPAGEKTSPPVETQPSPVAATPAPSAAASTSVVFDFAPWANIDSIVRKGDGQPVSTGTKLVTPCIVALTPGEYHVRASNPNFSQLEFDLTVELGNSQVVRRQMPGFDPRREISSIVDR